MKNLSLIVHADIEQALADTLRGLEQVSGFTFIHVEGHGAQDERDPAGSARGLGGGYTPHVRGEIFLKGEDGDEGVGALRGARGGVLGRGIYWITPVEKYGRL